MSDRDWRDDLYDDEDDRIGRGQGRGRGREEERRRPYEGSQGRQGYRGSEGFGGEGYRGGEPHGRANYGGSGMDRGYGRPSQFEWRRDRGWREDQGSGAGYGRAGHPGYAGRPHRGSEGQQGGWDDPSRQRGEDFDERRRDQYRDAARVWRDPSIYGETGGGFWDYRPNQQRFENRGSEERGFFDKAADEVASWFGDEGAEQRRRIDRHAGRGPRGYTRSDERIREDVSDRLTDDSLVDASDIEVAVVSGEVTLSGTVDHRQSKRRAEDIAESVSGVRHVQNNLRVQQPSSSSPSNPAAAGRSAGAAAMPGVGSASSASGTTSRESRETNPVASRG